MTYTVKPGDTLARIATRSGMTLAQLLQANPQIKDPNKIKVGEVVNVPDDPISTDNTRPLPSNRMPAAVGALGKAAADELGSLSAKCELQDALAMLLKEL